jgi:hypothetical protein
MISDDKPVQDWDDCPKGALVQAANVLKTRQRHRRAFAWTLGGMAAILLGWGIGAGSGWIRGFQSDFSPVIAGISCDRVIEAVDGYRSGRLSADLLAKVEAHLKLCPICRAEYEVLLKKAASSPDASRRLLAAIEFDPRLSRLGL